MNIEFYIPSRQVNESLVATVRDVILNLHRQHPTLTKAGVSFQQRKKIVTTERICEIRFFVSGKMNIISGSADTFDKAMRKAIEKLGEAINAYFKAHPETLESTLAPAETNF